MVTRGRASTDPPRCARGTSGTCRAMAPLNTFRPPISICSNGFSLSGASGAADADIGAERRSGRLITNADERSAPF